MSTHEYKAQLEAALIAVTEELSTIATLDEASGDWIALPDVIELKEADPNSEADGVEEWNERQATVAQLETTFRNTTKALLKIENGLFGICEICAANIELDRLNILPTARTCKLHRDDEQTLPL